MFSFIIFPTGIHEEAYYITLEDNNILTVTYGALNNLDPQDDNFFVKKSTKELTINNKTMIEIINLVDEISKVESFSKNSIRKGGWEITLFIEKKIYNFNYGEVVDNNVYKLSQIIIEKAGVDLHGWS